MIPYFHTEKYGDCMAPWPHHGSKEEFMKAMQNIERDGEFCNSEYNKYMTWLTNIAYTNGRISPLLYKSFVEWKVGTNASL